MCSFSKIFDQFNWKDISLKIKNKTVDNVNQAINKDKISLEDFMALISPSATFYLKSIIQKAKKMTRKRFGNIINLFIPLYLSNLCSNECTYCGFSIKNSVKRKVLNEDEIISECNKIYSMGYRNVLLVSGEHDKKVGVDYFYKCIYLIKQYFSQISVEIQPLTIKEYKKLKKIGLNGVIVYQETYQKESYKKYHLRGRKKDFYWRLDTPERVGESGISKIGLGILIGLSSDWRVDYYILANHLLYLQKKYWKSNYSVSFPRIQTCLGGISQDKINNITNHELVQLMCAFRLFFPEVEINLSTRESPYFRDNILPIMVNNISAGSSTQPGGYSKEKNELQQFELNDHRSPNEMIEVIQNSGLQPVWKDWDNYLGND
ncbi:MAG: 2-iminoacetate synthase ThiH [Arsenophonus sp.]|nr:MAG: 2-iminoacetate synthase ThiH [Arsenophonus sp.]